MDSSKQEATYQVEMSETQLQVISRALEMYERLGMGQLHELDHLFRSDRFTKVSFDYGRVEELITELKRTVFGFRTGESYSIRSEKISDDFRMCFDIEQVIRHQLAWDRNPQGGITLQYDKPYQTSKQRLPRIRKV